MVAVEDEDIVILGALESPSAANSRRVALEDGIEILGFGVLTAVLNDAPGVYIRAVRLVVDLSLNWVPVMVSDIVTSDNNDVALRDSVFL